VLYSSVYNLFALLGRKATFTHSLVDWSWQGQLGTYIRNVLLRKGRMRRWERMPRRWG